MYHFLVSLPVLLHHYLTNISWDHFLNESLTQVPSSQGLLFENLSEDIQTQQAMCFSVILPENTHQILTNEVKIRVLQLLLS